MFDPSTPLESYPKKIVTEQHKDVNKNINHYATLKIRYYSAAEALQVNKGK